MILDADKFQRSNEELIRDRDRFARAQATAHLGSWERDLRTGELTWSEETYRIFGLDSEQPITLGLFNQAVHPEDRERVKETIANVLRTGRRYEIEHRIVHPDGSERIVREQAELVRDVGSGQPIQLVGTVQDISERRQLEEQFRQAQKMEAVGRLAGGIAHDFNNLLTVILGYSNMLVDGDFTDRQAAEEILKAGQRAAALTQQLLAFSRRQVLQPTTLNLNASLKHIRPMLGRLLGEDIQIISVLEPDLWNISADSGQVDQVIMNMAVNARDAMPHGGKLIIETSNVELDEGYAREHIGVDPGQYVFLAITDNGSGMDAETQSRLFEPFFTTKEKGKGTGLGLSSVHGIIKQSGGNVSVYSEVGRGTTMKIYLPRIEGSVLPAQPSRLFNKPHVVGARILLVEDEPAVRQLAMRILAESKYEVVEASSAEEALEICEQEQAKPFQLLVTDLVLPKMDGFQLAKIVVERYPAITVLYSSGYTEHAVLNQEVMDHGACFLHKPFTPSALLEKVYGCLQRTPEHTESDPWAG